MKPGQIHVHLHVHRLGGKGHLHVKSTRLRIPVLAIDDGNNCVT